MTEVKEFMVEDEDDVNVVFSGGMIWLHVHGADGERLTYPMTPDEASAFQAMIVATLQKAGVTVPEPKAEEGKP